MADGAYRAQQEQPRNLFDGSLSVMFEYLKIQLEDNFARFDLVQDQLLDERAAIDLRLADYVGQAQLRPTEELFKGTAIREDVKRLY